MGQFLMASRIALGLSEGDLATWALPFFPRIKFFGARTVQVPQPIHFF